MAKFVCDFDEVYSTGEKLCSIADEMSSSVDSYASNIESDLNSWDGSAKGSFQTSNESQVQVSKESAEKIKSVGEFVKEASKAIQDLEEELASVKI